MVPKFPRPKGARKIKEPASAVEKTPSGATHGYLSSFDGTKLFYSVEGQGYPLIFCYGLVCSSLHWTYQIEFLRHHYRTIWFDYRGHHNSEMPKNTSTLNLESITKDLYALLEELKIPKAVILGHSMGVNIALEFFHKYPDRTAGLVLVNGTARRPLEKLFKTNATTVIFDALHKIYKISPAIMRKLFALQKNNPIAKSMVAFGGFNPHLTSEKDIELYIDQVASLDPAVFLNLIKDYSDYDASSWLHKINVPTLIVAGKRDLMTPIEEQELMHQLIPNSKLEVVHHGAHCAQMDLPDLVNLIIDRFLRENHLLIPINQSTQGNRQSIQSLA